MQREKLYNLHRTALLIIAGFVFKTGAIFRGQSSQCYWKTWHPRIPFFPHCIVYTRLEYRRCKFHSIWKQKIEQVNKRLYATCRAFHAASFVVFCFYSRKNIIQHKGKIRKNNYEKHIISTRPKHDLSIFWNQNTRLFRE